MRIYIVQQDDTVSELAVSFNTTTEAIVDANPAIFTQERDKQAKALGLQRAADLIFPGEELIIPNTDIDNLRNAQILETTVSTGLAVYIGGQRLNAVTQAAVTQYFDSVCDSFSILIPYDPNDESLQAITEPYSQPEVSVFFNGVLLIAGIAEKLEFEFNNGSNTVSFAGRSITYILDKSAVLPNTPKEYANLTLAQITQQVISPYGLELVVSDTGEQFEKAAIGSKQVAYAFLQSLATQRGYLLSNTADGKVIFVEAQETRPIYTIDLSDASLRATLGIDTLAATYASDEMYSTYVVRAQVEGEENITFTTKSPYITDQSLTYLDTEEPSQTSAQRQGEWEAKANAVTSLKRSFTFPGFSVPQSDRLWEAGDTVTLRAPQIRINEAIKLIVNSVTFAWTADKQTATLECIPPEAYASRRE